LVYDLDIYYMNENTPAYPSRLRLRSVCLAHEVSCVSELYVLDYKFGFI